MERMNPRCAVSYCSSIYYSLLCATASERNGMFSILCLVQQHFFAEIVSTLTLELKLLSATCLE